MSDQSYASLNVPYWVSSRGTDKILWNKLDNPPLAPLDKGITYELNDSRLYHNGNKLSYESETGTIQNGTTTKLSYYSDTNQISPSDMDYVVGRGIKQGDAWLISKEGSTGSIAIGNNFDLPFSYSIMIGQDQFKFLPDIANSSVVIGGLSCLNIREVSNSVLLGAFIHNSGSVNDGVYRENIESVMIGQASGIRCLTSNRSTYIGRLSGQNVLNSIQNIYVGYDAGPTVIGDESNTTRIGNTVSINRTFIAGIRNVIPDVADGNVVEISSEGQLTSSSSYVKGPANALDNTIVVYDQATGKLIKNTNILAVDRDITNVSNLEAENTTITTGSLFLPDTTSANVGTIRNSSGVLLHTGNGPSFETYLGYNNGNFTSTGINNTCVGGNTLNNLSSGSNNILFGFGSGANITTHSDNIIIGNFVTSQAGSNNIVIGNIAGVAEDNTIRIGGTQSSVYCDVINQKTPTEIKYVFIDSTGLLSTRTQLYKPHCEVLYGDAGLSLASFVLTTQNVWYSIDNSNFQTGIFSQDNNNAKFLTPKFDDNGIPGNSRFLSTTPDKGHSSISLSMNTSNATNIYQVCILQNGTPIPATIVYFDFANNNSYESIAYHKLLNMSQNDVFSIGIRCTSTNNATVGLYNLDFFIMGMEQQF